MGTQRYIDMTFDLSYPIEQPKFLQRLGETIPTDIVVQVKNKGVNYNLAGVTLGFEMRNDRDKILIDKDQSRFTIVSAAQGIFSYRPPEQMQSFFGNSYLAYFTFESGGARITTERFRFYNDEDVQLAIAPELQEHYVSVIDDLITSNEGAMNEAKKIEDLIKNNQVVKKAGDTMTGPLVLSGVLSRLEIDEKAGSIRISQPTDTTTSARGFQYYEGGNTLAGIGRIRNGGSTDQLYMGWGANPWDVNTSLTVSANQFTYKNKPVAMRDQDGRASLTLTSDATNPDTNYPLTSTRRGNTVTVSGSVSLNSATSGNQVSTLPSGHRPVGNLNMYFPIKGYTSDGNLQVFINTSGGIYLYGSRGKTVEFAMTYVVD
ncbi:BppU family phage baseplate upper protein [Bacillus cereus]|uniref:DUF2479 domain-containing protein n=1 Tax=Bacillus cereus TaxID=1396 RepID=A0A9X8IYF9_BACCE|nr:BppU family phage baseplate upper protein [Bacillus cereus]RWQ72955.1 DUF2479 domain-containing protein [Bacillus cereus]